MASPPDHGIVSPVIGQRGHTQFVQPKNASSPLLTPVNETENIFDRIRKMELDSKQEEFNFEAEPPAKNLLPLSSSKFQFLNSSSGSRMGINHAPTTPQEIVSSLNDDPYLMRSMVSGEGFSVDDVYRYFTSLSTENFSAAFTEISNQMQRLSIIDSLASTIVTVQDVEIGIPNLENILAQAFSMKTVLIWYNVPSANVLFSPTKKALIKPGVGIVGKSAENLKRRIIANPKESEWYNQSTDAPLFEDATAVVCSPIADPLTHQLIAVVSITAKSAWTQFDTVLLDHTETKLPLLLATLKISASKIRSTLAVLSSATGNELKQRPLISTACQSLKSALNCEVAQIFFIDWKNGRMAFYGNGVGKKTKVPLSQGGIAAFVAQDGHLVNVPVASEHPHFGKAVDDDYRSRSLIATPMVNESSTEHEIFGVVVARGKRGTSVFDEHDAILLESVAAVTSRSISNFQRYRSDVLNLKRVLTAQDHYIELLTTAESLSSVIDKDQLFSMIMTRSRRLVSADRCSLFTTDRKREYLLSKVASGTSKSIVIPISQGIAGRVATTGQFLNIADAYEDSRFNKDVDLSTGYRTKSILCLPIIGRNETVIGVTQMINKQSEGGVFISNDIDLMKAFNVFCGIALSNANLFDDTNTMKARVEGLLNLAMSMSRVQSLPLILESISESALALTNSERCTVTLVDGSIQYGGVNAEVMKTKKLVNIPDVSKDPLFDPSSDRSSGFTAKNLLYAPIMDQSDTVIGIVQLVNKVPGYNGLVFTEEDERLVTAMTTFASLSIAKVKRTSSKNVAVFDLYSGGTEQIGVVLQQMKLTGAEEEMLKNPSSYMRGLEMGQRLKFVINAFLQFNLLELLNIPFVVFFQSLMLIQAVASNLSYHNFDHSLDTLQFVYCILLITGEHKNFEPVELFALLMAALMHNTGYSGDNSETVQRSQVPLGILFKNQPSSETGQACAAIQMLTNKKINMIDSISASLQQKFWNIFIQLILSSGQYKQTDFVQLWKSGDHSKLNTMRLILKISNMGNVARPYDASMQHAVLLRKEIEQFSQEELRQMGSVEQGQLKFSQEIVLPMLDIAVSQWKSLDAIRQQLNDNMKRWKSAN